MTVHPADNQTAASDTWTVKRILDWTIQHFKNHGCESPRLDAEILLAHARGCDRIELYTRYDDVLEDDERATMRDLVRRRADSEPVAYLVGSREFFGLEMQVSADVLIPRPDTETLVMETLEVAKEFHQPRILDLCTGSGCIAIALAVNCCESELVAIDINEASLTVAKQNAERHEVTERIQFAKSDLFAEIDGDSKFNVIATNPPYVTTAELESLQPDVRLYEPMLALDGGHDGLDIVRRLVDTAPKYLVRGGYLLIEIDSLQAQAVLDLISANPAYSDASILTDLSGRPRVIRTKTVT